MEILQEDDGKLGRFYYRQDGQDLAEMVYQWNNPHLFTIVHTQVDDRLKGMGVAKALVEKGIAFARGKGLKIIPVCPYAKHLFDKTPAYDDVRYGK